MPVASYALRRLAQILPVALLVTVLIFLLIKLIPGDPATAILGGEVLGRQHDDRDGAPGLALLELVDQLEAVHLRHHQIQHDQAGRAVRLEVLQRPPAVAGLGHRPAVGLQGAADQLAGEVDDGGHDLNRRNAGRTACR